MRNEIVVQDEGILRKMIVKTPSGAAYLPKNFELALPEIPFTPNPTGTFLEGKVRLMVDYWRVATKPQYSKVLESPSWEDVLLTVDELLGKCQADYIFLEGLTLKTRDEEGVVEVELGFGS